MNCRRIIKKIEKRSFGNISSSDNFAIRFHLSYCKNCRDYERTSLLLDKMLKKSISQGNTLVYSAEEKQALVDHLQSNI